MSYDVPMRFTVAELRLLRDAVQDQRGDMQRRVDNKTAYWHGVEFETKQKIELCAALLPRLDETIRRSGG